MLDLLFSFKQDGEEQISNKNEEERYIPFEVVIDFHRKIIKTIYIRSNLRIIRIYD